MKEFRMMLLPLLLMFCSSVSAQISVPYHAFAKEGKVWNVQMRCERYSWEENGVEYMSVNSVFEYAYRLCGDTAIGGQTYYKVYTDPAFAEHHIRYTYPEDVYDTIEDKDPRTEGGESTLAGFFLREEGQRVYICYGDSEGLLYDFSATQGSDEGMDICGISTRVVDVDTIRTQDSLYFRRFYIERYNYHDGIDRVWVEGIGHPGGPDRVWGAEVNDGRHYTLLSVEEDGECIFRAEDFDGPAVTTGISAVSSSAAPVATAYDLQGRRQAGASHGVSIVRGADGSVRKVILSQSY